MSQLKSGNRKAESRREARKSNQPEEIFAWARGGCVGAKGGKNVPGHGWRVAGGGLRVTRNTIKTETTNLRFPLIGILWLAMCTGLFAQAPLPILTTTLDKAALPAGFTVNQTGNNYTTPRNPSLRLEATGQWLQVFFNSAPGTVSYILKANTSNSAPFNGTFTVQESVNGTDWITLRSITGSGAISIATAGSTFSDTPSSSSRYIRWFFTTKTSGNIAICDVAIATGGGGGTGPTISTTGTLTPFSATAGTASAAQSFTVTGTNLTAAISVSAPTGFEVSTDNQVTYVTSTNIAQSGGVVSNSVFVRIAAAASAGALSGNVTLASTGATGVNVLVSGTVTGPISLPFTQDFETNSFPFVTQQIFGDKNWTRTASTLGAGITTNSTNTSMQISGLNSLPTNSPAHSWLILGPLDCSAVTNPVLQFNSLTRYAFSGNFPAGVNELQLKVSSNYNGTGSPTNTTNGSWSNLAFIPPQNDLIKQSSGPVKLTGMAGQSNVYVAFQYQAAGITTGTALWQVDDVQVTEQPANLGLTLAINRGTIQEDAMYYDATPGSEGWYGYAMGTVYLPEPAGPGGKAVTLSLNDDSELGFYVSADQSGIVTTNSIQITVLDEDPSTAFFYLIPKLDNIIDGNVPVTITATAGGYSNGSATITVNNSDLPPIVPVSITSVGTPYNQNFNSLGTNNITNAISATVNSQVALGSVVNSALDGWFAVKLAGSSTSATALTVDNGSSSSGFLYSYGSVGAADRALGALASGSNTMGFGAVFKNDTSVTLQSFTVSFSAENWRGATAASKFTFGYGKFGSGLNSANFLSATGAAADASADITGDVQANPALDGNTIKKSVNVTLTVTVAPGESLFLRWQDFDDAGNDAGLAIDDFSLTANATVITTAPSLTGVTVDQPSLTPTQATVSSTVVSSGGADVTARGFVFTATATSADPTLSTVGAVSVTNTPGVGGFTSNLTNLTAGTVYTVKSYAINSVGTNYSSPTAFTTLAPYPTFTGVYTQNFANVTNSTLIPAGWRALSSGGVNSFQGSWTNASASTGGFYGREGSPGVLGYLHTSSTGILTNKLTLVNGTGGTLTNLFVSYTGEVNRTSNARFPVFTVAVGNNTNVAQLAYSTSGGTNAALSHEVTGLSIANGDTIVITWASDRGTNTFSGSSRMIGLTDVRVATTPANVATPPTITSTNAFAGTVGVVFSNNVTATGDAPIAFSGTGLPGGLSVASGGAITGTPSAAGTFNATLTATNAAGTNNQAVTFTIAKGAATITAAPTASAITAGQALSASTLSGGTASVAGTFAWTDGTIVPNATGIYGVTFTPTDTANYNTASTNVNVTVNPVAGFNLNTWLAGETMSPTVLAKLAIGGASSATASDGEKPAVSVVGGQLVLSAIVRTNGPAGLAVVGEAVSSLADYGTQASIATVTGQRASVQGTVPDGCERQEFKVNQDGVRMFLRLKASLP